MRKHFNLVHSIPLFSVCLFTLVARGQLSIPSDGSDGDFTRPVTQSDIVIDLAAAITGSWDTPVSAENAGKGIYDAEKWAVVFKYNSVTIRSNQVVSFKNHPSGAPVVWLVKGDVRIAGTLSLSGKYDTEIGHWEPGPGGFRPAFQDRRSGLAGYGGFGPGGGYFRRSWGAYSTLQTSDNGSGPTYGNSQILPLIGGSGAGFGEYGGWENGEGFKAASGGGGAIVIASAGEVTIEGRVFALSAESDDHYEGSGGAVRLIANRISGRGRIEARATRYGGGLGRIRIETPSYVGGLQFYPETAVVPPANPPLIWPKADSPTVRIVSVAGRPAAADPRASLEANPPADLSFQDDQPVEIVIETTNLDPSSVVKVRITPKLSGNAFDVPAIFDVGNSTRATWVATTKFARGYAALQVRAVGP